MPDQQKTERISLHLPIDKISALKKLAAKNGTDLSKEIRSAVDSYLDIEVSADNINLVTNVIRQELAGQTGIVNNSSVAV